MIKKAFLFMLFLILLIGISSANTLIGGTIYAKNLNETLSGIEVVVQCDSATSNMTTISLTDGSYYAVFKKENCNNIDVIPNNPDAIVFIYSQKIQDREETKNMDKVLVNSTEQNESNLYFLCGNDKCDTGESISTCSQDCYGLQTNEYLNPQNKTIINSLAILLIITFTAGLTFKINSKRRIKG